MTPPMKFKPGDRVDADEWTCEGEKISTPEKLAAIKRVLEESGPVLVRHSFLRGSCAPHQVVFDDYEEFVAYLTEHARAGDNIGVWDLWPFVRDTPPLAHGKCPADDGAIPKRGAY
jgi:hypothetical protein